MGYNPLYQSSTLKVPARALATGYVNGSISDIPAGTPVSLNAAGQILPTDVTNEASAQSFIGLAAILIPSAASGNVYHVGRAEGLGLTGFNLGDNLYVGLNGTLINVQPDYQVSGFDTGDWVIYLGVVVKNEFDSTKQDVLISTEIRGQL